ncbi:carbamoyltransferase C-terminal domain-containing protein [Carboxylicivirga sp. N1Y90]|uniref:carbamoyltransferase C-terminal domain-containing protein n=1 Tax=Carboxylicivirga fragile TaxID=3417571 RepID=UPI003D332F11|nr:hypothetical protein [Marinilabiliaceae bacterium N1Y90]
MDKKKATLAIYGIQDRINTDTPFYVHDHGLTLMNQGKVIKHLSLERLSRRKHDNTLHEQIYELLKSERLLRSDDYDLVFVDNVVGRAFISSCGRFRFEAPLNQNLLAQAELGRCWWLDKEKEAYAINHELAHIASCLPFYGAYKENSLLVHFDGGGSLSNFSAWQFRNNQLCCIEFHWDLKYLSALFNANALVFGIIGAKYKEQNSVPGKMMGLAAFGTYRHELEDWLKKHNYFTNLWASKKAFIDAAQKDFGWQQAQLNERDFFLQDLIATMQGIFQRDFLTKLSRLQDKEDYSNLYYSGGSALNIVTNKAIIDSQLFDNVYIPPCPDDSGLSLGAAAHLEWQKHGQIHLHNPYLNNWQLASTDDVVISELELDKCAQALLANKVVAVCNGTGEIGPRALGNRSILSLANSTELAKKVSMEHKRREWYRPVAPIMLDKNAVYFTGKKLVHRLAQYMLLDFEIEKNKQTELQGAVHVDGTARIQVIENRGQNPFMFALLTLLDNKYGIKALINTSFNVRGEPIVQTKEDAINSAKNMNLDGLVINGYYQSL